MKIDGEFLKSQMKEKGIKTIDLADKVNVTHTAVSKWIHGQRPVGRSHILKICDVLGITVEQLTGCNNIPLKPFETVDYALMILRAHGWKYEREE